MAGRWLNDGTLPSGWEHAVDDVTGQSYFIDHNAKTTSWVDPRDLHEKPESFAECYDGGLAMGWEYAIDPTHGEYFIDHNTWTTTFDDPRVLPRDPQPGVQGYVGDGSGMEGQSVAGFSMAPSMAPSMGAENEMFEKLGEWIASVKEEQQELRQQVQDMHDGRRGGSPRNRNFNIDVGDNRGDFVTPGMLNDQFAKSHRELLPHMESMLSEHTIPKWRLNGQFNKVQDEIAMLKDQLKELRKPKEKLRQWNNEQQWFAEVRDGHSDSPSGQSSSTLSKANLDAHESRSRRSSESAVRRSSASRSAKPSSSRRRLSSTGSAGRSGPGDRRSGSPSRRRLSRRGSEHSISGMSVASVGSELEELRLEELKLQAQKEMQQARIEEL